MEKQKQGKFKKKMIDKQYYWIATIILKSFMEEYKAKLCRNPKNLAGENDVPKVCIMYMQNARVIIGQVCKLTELFTGRLPSLHDHYA